MELNKARQEIRRLTAELDRYELYLLREGYQRCDIEACNCGWWHQHDGFKRRFDEINEATEYWWRNGEPLLDRVYRICKQALNPEVE